MLYSFYFLVRINLVDQADIAGTLFSYFWWPIHLHDGIIIHPRNTPKFYCRKCQSHYLNGLSLWHIEKTLRRKKNAKKCTNHSRKCKIINCFIFSTIYDVYCLCLTTLVCLCISEKKNTYKFICKTFISRK